MANERGAENPTPENTPPGSGNPSSQENPNVRRAARGLGATDAELGQIADELGIPQDRRGAFNNLIRVIAGNRMEGSPGNSPRENSPDDALSQIADATRFLADSQLAQQQKQQEAQDRLPKDPQNPDKLDQRRIDQRTQEIMPEVPLENIFLPPAKIDGETEEAWNTRVAEKRRMVEDSEYQRAMQDRKNREIMYWHQKLQETESIEQAEWVIEDALRAGEFDTVSPDTFQQSAQQVQQAIELVYLNDNPTRERLARLVRARLYAYIGEFNARYINAGELGKVVTNFFQSYFEEIIGINGVSRAMQLIEESDKSEGTNIRGAYFRKLNFEDDKDRDKEPGYDAVKERNKQKRKEYYHLYNHKKGFEEIKNKDSRWGVWIVDKKMELYDDAVKGNKFAKLDYLEDFKDPEDRDLIKILLARTHGKSDPIKEMQGLHKFLHPDLYTDKPDDNYFLANQDGLTDEQKADRVELIDKLKKNEKFRKAIRPLPKEEQEFRRLSKEQSNVLTENGVTLDRLVYQIHRAFTLSQRVEHNMQYSTMWDNMRWKKEKDMTASEKMKFYRVRHDLLQGLNEEEIAEYGVNKLGNLVVLNPIVEWETGVDPRYQSTLKNEDGTPKKKKVIKVNLRTAAEKKAKAAWLDDKIPEEAALKKAILADPEVIAIDEIRDKKNHLFIMAWDKAWREFYIQNWDLLDFENSFSGDSSREARKAAFFGRTLEQSGEAEPGIRALRKYAETGFKPMGMFFAFASARDQIHNWDSVFNRVKRWAGSAEQGQKLRGVLMDVLNNPEIVTDPVKFLSELKKNYRPIMSTDPTYDRAYYTDEEYKHATHEMDNQLDYVIGEWAEGIIKFNKEESWQVHRADVSEEIVTRQVADMSRHELISPHRALHILRTEYGPDYIRHLRDFMRLWRPKEAFIEALGEFFEELPKAFFAGLKAA